MVFLGEERRRCVLSTCGVVGGTSAAWFFVDPVELSSGKVGEGSNGFAGGWRSRVHEESRIEDVVWANCSGRAWRQWLWRTVIFFLGFCRRGVDGRGRNGAGVLLSA